MKNTGRVKWWIIGALMVGILVLCRLPFTCVIVSAAEGTDPVTPAGDAPVEATYSLWTDGLTADPTYNYNDHLGTQGDPYLIESETDLAMLSLNVYNGTEYGGKYFKLDKDLDLSGKYWLPIGTNIGNDDHPFKGAFDGNGNKINNMTVSNTADPRVTKYAGLFGKTQENVNIHDLGLQNARIELGDEFDGAYVGLLLGYAYQNANIDKCFAQGCVFISESGKASRVGGLVGCSSYWGSSIRDSYIIGDLDIRGTAKDSIGGIVGGYFDEGAVSLDNCYAAARINVISGKNPSTLGSGNGSNSYYDASLPLNRDYASFNGTGKNKADMKKPEMASLLNGDEGSAWAQSDDVNTGYPYLKTVKPDYTICTVTFDVNGYGEALADQMVLSGNRLIQPTANDGKKYIAGWYRDPECTEENKWDFDNDTVDSSMTLYADWKVATLWTDGMVADKGCGFSGGAGTEDEPYLIATPRDLAVVAQTVYEQGNVAYSGQYLSLADDIDLGGLYWLPIGTNNGNDD
ncbi:MAG: InlB B-repeat-containing protein, partial [Lachnospiraceae bacterium]|nr:InlB B-repeat-containing protein [Lachnospiraceae bacterium]